MKKLIGLVLCIATALTLGACANKSDGATDIPDLNEISNYTQEQLEEKLLGFSNEEIHNSWGEPDAMLSGSWGDIWMLINESDRQIALYYDKNGVVENIQVSE